MAIISLLPCFTIMFLSSIYIFCTLATAQGQKHLPAAPVAVHAPAGTIIGQTCRLNSSVHEFLGIPFAEPPTGSLRFEPPVRKPRLSIPISARQFGLSCPSFYTLTNSPLSSLFSNFSAAEGEDCLSLNIWKRSSIKNAPVLVWFYGGGFISGTSNSGLIYDGTFFAAHNDVIVVTINYRTNVFGFPNSPTLATNNAGLLDQRMAVEWVRDNIAAFGGNPDQITIFGQSAGAASVDIWAYAWANDPIVKGFISLSGTVFLLPFIGGGATYDAWNNLTIACGCGSGTETQQLSCMKKLDWQVIRSALHRVWETLGGSPQCGGGIGVIPGFFAPRADGKIVFSFDEYLQKGVKGEFAKLPLLIGNTDREIPPIQPSNSSSSAISKCPQTATDTIFSQLPIILTPEVVSNISTALAFTCPARTQARFRTANNVPVWRYRFFDSMNFTTSDLNLHATHGSEIPLIFGYAAEIENLHPREAEILKDYQAALAAFARNPSAGLSDTPFKWYSYSLNELEKSLVKLAYGDEQKPSMSRNLLYDYLCDFLEVVEAQADPEELLQRR